MLEEMRFYITRVIAQHKDALSSYTGKLAPIQMSRLEKEKKEGNYWEAQWVGDDEHNIFEVRRYGHRITVNTLERTCTCRKWQLTGLPCCHGVAAIQKKNHWPEDNVHHWLCMEHYNRAYQFHINSVPSEEYWVNYEGYSCLPPLYKRPIERPTKKRARYESERQAKTASGVANEQEDATDLSDREQEMYYEETLEVADEQQVTQGHPQSQTDNEQAQGLESNPTAASDSTTAINKSAPPKVAGAVAAALRFVRSGASSARTKIPIMRPPCTIVPAHNTIRPPQVRPNVAAAPTTRATSVRPNVPFRPAHVRPNVAGRPNIPVKPNTSAQVHVPNSSSSAPLLVSHQLMNAASKGTTKRFIKFMPTPAPSKPSQKPKKKP
ncbi:hypothetical protein AHAS_Ahas01G0107800 [Arachis hypogaea]